MNEMAFTIHRSYQSHSSDLTVYINFDYDVHVYAIEITLLFLVWTILWASSEVFFFLHRLFAFISRVYTRFTCHHFPGEFIASSL